MKAAKTARWLLKASGKLENKPEMGLHIKTAQQTSEARWDAIAIRTGWVSYKQGEI